MAAGSRAETSWIGQHISSVPFLVYHYDDPAAAYTFPNVGNEAMACAALIA